MTTLTLYRGAINDQLITLPHLRSGRDESQYINDAALVANLYTEANAPLGRDAGTPHDMLAAVALSLAAGSVDGTYELVLDETFNPDLGTYYLVISGSTPAGDDFGRIYKVRIKDPRG